MPWGLAAAAVGAAGSIYAGSQQAGAAQQAAQTSAGATQAQVDLQRQIFQQQQANQAPWLQAGQTALGQLTAGTTGPNAPLMKTFTTADFQQDPGYQFRLQQGLQALDRSASARGGLLSGAALKGIQQYGQGLASQEYGDAYNRYQQQQANQFNRLAALSGVGQTATQQLQQAGQQYGANVGNIAITGAQNQANALLAAGQARASSYGGVGQAIGGALQNPNVQNYLSGLF